MWFVRANIVNDLMSVSVIDRPSKFPLRCVARFLEFTYAGVK